MVPPRHRTGAVVASILELRCDFRTGAVFLGFPPIKNAKTGDVCSHDSKWSRAVQAALAGFDAARHGVFFLDLECPLARLPHSSYAHRSPGHRHLPGGPDLANAILMRFLARVNE